MGKIGLILATILVILGCSACSINVNINTDDNSKEKAEVVAKEQAPAETPEKVDEEKTDAPVPDEDMSRAFYGVWCSANIYEIYAENDAMELMNKGFDAKVFVTTDWENLNSEKFYVVTAGVCETKEEAQKLLIEVKGKGYTEAYIKYTGNRK